jgi:hypothetical protein
MNKISVAPGARGRITSNRISAGGTCAPYVGFVAAKPCFRGRWQFCFVMTQRGTHCVMAGLRARGSVDMMAEVS